MATKKGLTTKALAKATKRLLEDIPSGIPKKKPKDDSVLSKSAANKLIVLHEQAMKDNKSLSKKVANLQKIKITTSGFDRSVEDKVITKRTVPEEEVEDTPVNIPKSYALFSGMSGDRIIDYRPEMMEIEDDGVLESVDEFIGKNNITIQQDAMESNFTVDLSFFGDKPQPLNKQKFRNYMEKFEVIDYQIPDLPASSKVLNGKTVLTVPMLTHFKVTNSVVHKANFQMHNIDSLVNYGFHETLSSLSMCYSTQIVFSTQPIELGDLAIFEDERGDEIINREKPTSSFEFEERCSLIPQRKDSFIYYSQTLTRVSNIYDRKVDGNKIQTFTPRYYPKYEIVQHFQTGFEHMAMQSFIPGENIHGLVRLSYQKSSMLDIKDVKDASALVALWYDVDMPKIEVEMIYHESLMPIDKYYNNELWDSEIIAERGRTGVLTISGMGFDKDHDSGIVSNKQHKNNDNITTDRDRVNLLINGAVKKRGVCCFIGREIRGVKKRNAGAASMFLPFVLAESNGLHHRVVSTDDGEAIILPNIPTVCLTDENSKVNGYVAVGTKNPLPSIISFLNKDDKVTFVKEDESSLPTKEEKKQDEDEDEHHHDEEHHDDEHHHDNEQQVHFNL